PENLITFDGAPATRTRSNGTSIGAADVDSTQEVQILTADYAPEYGRSSGAQIRIVTKTGTQTFHGAAYEYLRNNHLNANTWARNSNPLTEFAAPLHYNQFGYNFGGPFYIPGKFNTDKSKVFFYWGEEWIRYHWTESGSTVPSAGLLTVPTLKMRQGDFSELLDPNNPFVKTPVHIKDPQSSLPCTTADQSGCFPGNIIPANRLSPTGIGILNAWPIPNLANYIGGNGNWFGAALHTQHQRKDTLAVDINVTTKQRLAFRRQQYAYLEYQPLDGKPDPNRIPTVNMTNFSQLSGGPYPSHSAGPIYDVSDSFTWVKGSHTWKFGALFERAGENDNDEINVQACPTCTANQNGQFLFSDTRSGGTGVAVANAALGLFDTYSEIGHR